MVSYVLGLAFNKDASEIVLVQKEHGPTAGKWNGIGGQKKTANQTSRAEMVDIFNARTGCATVVLDWWYAGKIEAEKWQMVVYNYHAPNPGLILPRQQTDESEDLAIFKTDELQLDRGRFADYLPVLVDLCRRKLKSFTIIEARE